MKCIVKIIVLSMGLGIWSYGNGAEKSLHAHEHGAIKVAMAIENKLIEISIDGPAESFLGFEYVPKTKKEKEVLSTQTTKWTKHLESLISFDKKLHCLVTEASFKQVMDQEENAAGSKKESGVHSDIEAVAKLSCDVDPVGSEVTISLKKNFPHIKKLLVEIISSNTKTIDIKKDVQVFKI